MNILKNLMYTKSHEWVDFTGENTGKIGLSDFAQHSLDSLVFVNLPEEGDVLTVDEPFGDVESVKAVSDVYSPVSGTVLAINEELLDAPGKINEDPYGSWMVEVSDITNRVELMDAAEYEKFCAECSKEEE